MNIIGPWATVCNQQDGMGVLKIGSYPKLVMICLLIVCFHVGNYDKLWDVGDVGTTLLYYETKHCMLCHNIYTNQGVNVSSARNSGVPDRPDIEIHGFCHWFCGDSP